MCKVIRRLSIVCFYFVSFALMADAPWPLPDGVRPIAPASTWQDNGNVKIDFSGKGRIRGAINGTEIGYKNGSELAGNHGNACDDGECEANQQLRLPADKNQIAFNAPNGAIPINLSGNTTISESGIYEATSSDVQIGRLTIASGASVLLYADKLKVDGGRINVESGDANDFVLVVTDDTEFINAGTVDGHIISEKYLLLKSTNLTGTLITDELKIDEGGLLGGELPDPPDFQTCEFKGNDDFIIEMTVTGSSSYKELYVTRKNDTQRYQTLWYNQDPPPNPPSNYPEEFLFLETGLQDGVTYNIRIEYAAPTGNGTGTAYYYLKQESDPNYVLQEQVDANIQTGQLAGQGDGIEQLDCENDDVISTPEIPPICDVFPSVAQSWVGAPTSTIDFGNSTLIGTFERSGRLGFEQVNRSWETQQACDGKLCVSDATLAVAEPDVISLSIPSDVNLVDPDQPVAPGEYTSITMGNGRSFTFSGGVYQIGTLIVNGGASLDIPEGSQLFVNKLEFSNAADVSVIGAGNNGIVIWAEDYQGTPAHVNLASDRIDSLTGYIFSRGVLDITGSARVIGSVAADRVNVLGSVSVEYTNNTCGTVPPQRQLRLTPKQAINLTCDAPEVLDFQVLDSTGRPDSSFNGNIIVNFSGSSTYTTRVTQGAANGGNSYRTNGQGLLQMELSDSSVGVVSVDAFIEGSEDSTLQQGSYEYVPNKFEFSPSVVPAIANRVEAIRLQAMQCDSNGNPSAIPADKYSGEKSLSLSSTNYLQPQNDVQNRVNVELREVGETNWTEVNSGTLAVTFDSNATADLELKYAEAGSVAYQITDEVCIIDEDGEEQCESIKGIQQVDAIPWTFAICHKDKSLNGTAYLGDAFVAAGRSFELELRPLQYQDNASNEPVLGINVGGMCNDPMTQNFFGSDAPFGSASLDATLATPEVSRGGSLGDGLRGEKTATNTGKQTLNLTNLLWDEVGSLNVQVNGQYLQREIATGYRNVGRFYPDHLVLLSDYFDAPTGHDEFTYMGQKVAGHGFIVEARNALAVEDETDNVTNNYGLFDSSLVVTIDYDAFDDQGVDLKPRLEATPNSLQWSASDWGDTTGQLAIDFSAYQFNREAVAGSRVAAALTTRADGPYNSSNSTFGLKVTEVIDEVNWQGASEPDELEEFTDDHDFRYGRMVLSDVAGNSDSIITVPLKVEHWDGSRFVVNTDDGIDIGNGILGSRYDGQYFCIQPVWEDQGSSDPQLDGSGGVMEGTPMDGTASNGETSTPLVAHQGANSGNRREQSRLWLHIGDSAPEKASSGDPSIDCSLNYTDRPWLRYNWRNLGDEDPSAVITFGTFRGNDRVIYRGETGLTGN